MHIHICMHTYTTWTYTHSFVAGIDVVPCICEHLRACEATIRNANERVTKPSMQFPAHHSNSDSDSDSNSDGTLALKPETSVYLDAKVGDATAAEPLHVKALHRVSAVCEQRHVEHRQAQSKQSDDPESKPYVAGNSKPEFRIVRTEAERDAKPLPDAPLAQHDGSEAARKQSSSSSPRGKVQAQALKLLGETVSVADSGPVGSVQLDVQRQNTSSGINELVKEDLVSF
jgi:hypothetical protein